MRRYGDLETGVGDGAARPDGKIVWDDALPGFGVRSWISGRSVYVIQYRNKDGVLRRLTLGTTDHMTLPDARRLARIKLSEVDKGRDPVAEKRDRRKGMTVESLCDLYLADVKAGRVLHRGKPKSPKTIYNDEGRIRRHIKPLLGRKVVERVELSDVEEMYEDIIEGKTACDEKTGRHGRAIVTGGVGTAVKSVTLLSAMFNYGKRKKYCEENPCEGMQLAADGKRERALTEVEYRKFGEALLGYKGDDISPVFLDAIWMLALTGCRKSEMINLESVRVRPEKLVLDMDTKIGRQLRVCSQTGFAFLKRIMKEGRTWVFPSVVTDGPIVKIDKPLRKICAAAGLEGVTCHTLRHSFGTVAGELNYSDFTVGTLLGHSKRTVTGIYMHAVDKSIAAAADNVAAEIARRMGLQLEGVKPPAERPPEVGVRPRLLEAVDDGAYNY